MGFFDSGLDITQLPGLTGTAEGQDIYNQLQGLFDTGLNSPELSQLRNLMGGAPVQRTADENAIIQDLVNISGAGSAARGLGAPTAGGIAQNVAPTLANQRQQRVSNLQKALGLQLSSRGQDIQGLLGLGGLVMPQNIVQSTSSGLDKLQGLLGLASGAVKTTSGIQDLFG